jgi:hypothetical protein
MRTGQRSNRHISDHQGFDIWSLRGERGENSRAAKRSSADGWACSNANYLVFDIGTFSKFPPRPIISSSASDAGAASASSGLSWDEFGY